MELLSCRIFVQIYYNVDLLFEKKDSEFFKVTNNNIIFNIRTYVKFMFSNKATKIDEIFTADLTLCSMLVVCTMYLSVKSKVKISSIFVAFLENMNFTIKNLEISSSPSS